MTYEIFRKYNVVKECNDIGFETLFRKYNANGMNGIDLPENIQHFAEIEDGYGNGYYGINVVKVPNDDGSMIYLVTEGDLAKYSIHISNTKSYTQVQDKDGDIIYYENNSVIDERGYEAWKSARCLPDYPKKNDCWRCIKFKNSGRKKCYFKGFVRIYEKNGEYRDIDDYEEA